MNESHCRLTVTAGVAELTLARSAKRNALTRGLIAQLASGVASAAAESSLRLLIVSAEGPAFCAGMDLDEMQQRAASPDARSLWEQDARMYRDLLAAILALDVPTLAVVDGPAIAGGFGIVLACDLVLASPNARFALPETMRGISPAVVAPLLIHRVGIGAAVPILLGVRALNADEALALNVCHFLADADGLSQKRQAVVGSLLSAAPGALAATKRLLRSLVEPALSQQLDAGMAVSARARETAEAREGLASFQERRPPAWCPDSQG